MRALAIIQARMSSSRLPGKVLEPLGGMPAIGLMALRLQSSRLIDRVIVATSVDPSDDPLATVLRDLDIEHFRGDLLDVLGRYVEAAATDDADVIVRLTGDCPLIDPRIVDDVIALVRDDVVYASNTSPATFPHGLDAEAFTRDTLMAAQRHARLDYEREHVTPWMRSSGLKTANLVSPIDLSQLRWTVDYPEDLARVRAVVGNLDKAPDQADLFDLLRAACKIPDALFRHSHPRQDGQLRSSEAKEKIQ